jgi:hypothetical protein
MWWNAPIVLLLIASSTQPNPISRKPSPEARIAEQGTADVLVVLSDATNSEPNEVIQFLANLPADGSGRRPLSILREYQTFPGFAATIDARGLATLRDRPEVESVECSMIHRTLLDGSVVQTSIDDAWAVTVDSNSLTGAGGSICVLDSGIDTDHAAFAGRIVAQKCFCRLLHNVDGLPCCPDDTDESDSAEDDYGHGTHVSGIAAGDHPVYRGVAYESGIVAVKVCGERGKCSGADILAGIDWCVANKDLYEIEAINISLGGGLYETHCDWYAYSYSVAIDAAVAAGVTVVAASGNSGSTNGMTSPACIENVIPVGGVNQLDEIIYNRGPALDLLAPASQIAAAFLGGHTASLSGTSMAAPHVSGTIASMTQYRRLRGLEPLSHIEHEGFLARSGQDVYDPLSDRTYARIDVYNALFAMDDCNSNGSLDGEDLENETSGDWNANSLPDECDGLGDLDSNGIVDARDMSGLGDCLYGPQSAPNPSTCVPNAAFRADMDGDSDVDLADFARFCLLVDGQ